MPLRSLARIAAPLAANAPAHPLDVLRIKSMLAALGHYEAPDWGVTPYPDRALFDAVSAFQRERGLTVDGHMKPDGETETALSQALVPQVEMYALAAMAEAVRAMGRNGDTVLAHITPQEAALLDAVTDGMSINPATGLPEFFYGGFGGQPDGGVGRRPLFDISHDHKIRQNEPDQYWGRKLGADLADLEHQVWGSGPEYKGPQHDDGKRALEALTEAVASPPPDFGQGYLDSEKVKEAQGERLRRHQAQVKSMSKPATSSRRSGGGRGGGGLGTWRLWHRKTGRTPWDTLQTWRDLLG